MLRELWNSSPEVHQFIETNIHSFNGAVGNPKSFDLLDSLLDEQLFRLSYWKVGNEELNYRRFFTINDLISLRIEDARVFDFTHELILKLVAEEKISGLRIDHIDGLYEPAQYLHRLRERVPYVYLVVEKILEHGEGLPVSWPPRHQWLRFSLDAQQSCSVSQRPLPSLPPFTRHSPAIPHPARH